MEGILKEIIKKYNNINYTDEIPMSTSTALRILKEGASDVKSLGHKIRQYEIEELKMKMEGDFNDLKNSLDIVQPSSIMMKILYIDLLTDSMLEAFFKTIKINRERLVQIVVSITLYTLFLQTYSFSNQPITTTEKKWLLGRDDFYYGIDELRIVCWDIEQHDLDTFRELFAFDISKNSCKEWNREYLFADSELIFVLSLEEFLEYIMFEIENLYKKHSTQIEFSQYSHKKGFGFENLVYNFLKRGFEKIEHSLYYYPSYDKEAEIDILIQDNENLIIVECKSGTTDLRSASTDDEIKIKIKNKVNKAYKTLEMVNQYISSNAVYEFKNKENVIHGKSASIEVLCLHLSMYPLDFISSNVHVLNNEYIGRSGNPKITMSFEHLMSIFIDAHNQGMLISDYLKKRKANIINHPKTSFDINELDLYYQMTDKNGKSILSEFMDNGMFEIFNEDVKLFSTFNDEAGKEFRPATDLIRELDSYMLDMLLTNAKAWLGLNKRYVNNLKEYLVLKS